LPLLRADDIIEAASANQQPGFTKKACTPGQCDDDNDDS